MSCKNCISKSNGTPRGCNNNGACTSNSCNTFTVFDWLNDITAPNNKPAFPFVRLGLKMGEKAILKLILFYFQLEILLLLSLKKGMMLELLLY